MPDIRTAGTASPREGDVAPDRIRRLDIARWTLAGFEIAPDLRALAAADAMVAVETVRIYNATTLHVGTGRMISDRFPGAARLVILRAGAEAVVLATLRRADFLAPQWLREWTEDVPVYLPAAPGEVRGYSRAEPCRAFLDTITLDATAPGWQEGDVVAVVGEE
jgi:hypothetical protein